MKALLIIDMQKGCFTPYTACHDTLGVIQRINTLSEMFRAKGYPVIIVQHDGSSENCLIPGTSDWNLLPELVTDPADIRLNKKVNDSFYGTALQEILIQHGVIELIITGYATDFCIDTTVKSAFSRDYTVTVAKDAHTTENKPYAEASTLIKHYNWVWSVMPFVRKKINVFASNEIEI